MWGLGRVRDGDGEYKRFQSAPSHRLRKIKEERIKGHQWQHEGRRDMDKISGKHVIFPALHTSWNLNTGLKPYPKSQRRLQLTHVSFVRNSSQAAETPARAPPVRVAGLPELYKGSSTQ